MAGLMAQPISGIRVKIEGRANPPPLRGSDMAIFGWVIATLGTAGLVSSVILEVIKKEPIYLLTAKISAGIFGVGGILIGVASLT